jgi:DNA-binding winged helix-turn-helix (wHTH) protein
MGLRHFGSIRFGLFEFNHQGNELRKRGLKVKIGPQACKVLALLLEHPGQLRTREELLRRLWPVGTFVDFEHSLNKAIHALRDALGDSAISPRYIETVVGEGYRFILLAQETTGPAARARKTRRIGSLAVLPLASEPADPEIGFLKRIIIERVIDTISRISRIRVLAYGTVQGYLDTDLDPRTVGQDLLVHAVTAGEIVRRNDEMRLHVELISINDGIQLWGGQFKEPYCDVLTCPDKLADEISNQLRRALAPNVKPKPDHIASSETLKRIA